VGDAGGAAAGEGSTGGGQARRGGTGGCAGSEQGGRGAAAGGQGERGAAGGGQGERGAAHVFVDDLEHPVLVDDDHRHLERVLRLRAGETVSAADDAGGWRLLRWEGAGRLTPAGGIEHHARPEPAITVAFALMKGDRLDWVVQKLTELGVDRIIPMTTQRVIVRWDEARADRAVHRLRSVARAAAMQSRRVWLPRVDGVRSFSDLATEAAADRATEAAADRATESAAGRDEGGEAEGGPAVLGPAVLGPAVLAVPGGGSFGLDRPTVLIGPEGGWSPDEVSCGLPTVGLGPTILRVETAAAAAGLLLMALRSGIVAPPAASNSDPTF